MRPESDLRHAWEVLLDGRSGWEAFLYLYYLTIGLLVVIATILLILIVGPEQ